MKTLTLAIPCYNEEAALPPLFKRLAEVKRAFDPDVQLDLLFVDDGSKDRTPELLAHIPHELQPARVVRHNPNQGLGAAIRTGLKEARGEFIAQMDADCTYDPMYLVEMIRLMKPGVDVVTGSEWHPQGKVEGITPLRWVLSRGLSLMYQIAFWSRLYSFSCLMRIYRRSIALDILPESNGFLSCTEVLLRAHKLGYRIIEYPLVLTTRQHGETKMPIFKTIFEHLGFIAGSVFWKVRKHDAAADAPPGATPSKEGV
jgi:dolichol-phosphate mannosyltransferase